MRKITSSSVLLILVLIGSFVSLIATASQVGRVAGQQDEPILFEAIVPVRGTYVFADNNAAWWDDNGDGVDEPHYLENPLIVDLDANGFKPGDLILIKGRSEMYYARPNLNNPLFYSGPNTLWGVFSSSNIVLWEIEGNEVGPMNRVPGAIGAGEPFESPLTYNGYPTDIPEDFYCNGSAPIGTSVRIPQGAAYLMFSGSSGLFTDNDGWTKVTIDKDTDGDGLWDSWESNGIDINRDETIDLELEGADWQHKDIYVEVDWLPGHRPLDAAMDDVKTAFDEADIYNPDLSTGIHLHIELDEGVAPSGGVGSDVINMWEHFDLIKKEYFGNVSQRANAELLEAKKWAYHYCLFVHQYAAWNATSSKFETTNSTGLSERPPEPGNDFIAATGMFSMHGGRRDQQAAIFMHELGHNLGLQHGGQDDVNYKPNYLSVMNYMYCFNELIPSRPLDYSRERLKTLDESKLNETDGLGVDYVSTYSSNWRQIIRPVEVVDNFRRIDWNQDLIIDGSGVQANINTFPQWQYTSPADEKLESYVDWTKLKYAFYTGPYFADGVHGSEAGMYDEITTDVIEMMHQAALRLRMVTLSVGENTETSMRITWTQSADPSFAQYQLFQSTTPGQLGTLIGTITNVATLTQIVTGLSSGTTYYFTVRAMDTDGFHTDSAQLSGTTVTPLWQQTWFIGLIGAIILGVVVIAILLKKR